MGRFSQRGASRGHGGFSRGRGGARGRGRGRGRGGRSESKATPTLEELNAQLDAYNSKVILYTFLCVHFQPVTVSDNYCVLVGFSNTSPLFCGF